MSAMNRFAASEDLWLERLGNLRNAVRQELIGRQLGEHVRDGSSVLDVGCGQAPRQSGSPVAVASWSASIRRGSSSSASQLLQ